MSEALMKLWHARNETVWDSQVLEAKYEDAVRQEKKILQLAIESPGGYCPPDCIKLTADDNLPCGWNLRAPTLDSKDGPQEWTLRYADADQLSFRGNQVVSIITWLTKHSKELGITIHGLRRICNEEILLSYGPEKRDHAAFEAQAFEVECQWTHWRPLWQQEKEESEHFLRLCKEQLAEFRPELILDGRRDSLLRFGDALEINFIPYGFETTKYYGNRRTRRAHWDKGNDPIYWTRVNVKTGDHSFDRSIEAECEFPGDTEVEDMVAPTVEAFIPIAKKLAFQSFA